MQEAPLYSPTPKWLCSYGLSRQISSELGKFVIKEKIPPLEVQFIRKRPAHGGCACVLSLMATFPCRKPRKTNTGREEVLKMIDSEGSGGW